MMRRRRSATSVKRASCGKIMSGRNRKQQAEFVQPGINSAKNATKDTKQSGRIVRCLEIVSTYAAIKPQGVQQPTSERKLAIWRRSRLVKRNRRRRRNQFWSRRVE